MRLKDFVKSYLSRLDSKPNSDPEIIPNAANVTYSPQYSSLLKEAHKSQIPSFGAPTLVWHVALWHTYSQDPSNIDLKNSESTERFSKLQKNLVDRQNTFSNNLDKFLLSLQVKGRTSSARALFGLRPQPNCPATSLPRTFSGYDHQSVAFTLWWHDRDNGNAVHRPGIPPLTEALRIRVQAEAHIDHISLSFFMDAGAAYDHKPGYFSGQPGNTLPGERRRRIFDAVNAVRECGEARFNKPSSTETPLLPEPDVTSQEAADLKNAADLLYSDLWGEFCTDYGFNLSTITDGAGEIFADFRGLVMTTTGLGCEGTPPETATRGLKPFAKFDLKHQPAPSSYQREANATVKAYWPFIRRITPFADYREYIATGVLNWRAIYVTALGAGSHDAEGDESQNRRIDVPEARLQEDAEDFDVSTNKPIRYLFLTKCEPHKRQIGRIVARINALGTARLFALKDLDVIKEASDHIRLRGLHLDHVTSEWSLSHQTLENAFRYRALQRGNVPKLPVLSKEALEFYERYDLKNISKIEKLEDKKEEIFAIMATEIEHDLIEISAALNKIGLRAAGGLPYTINRSKYYREEFETLIKTLEAGNIESWVSYNQFYERGVKPSFDFIKMTGDRLNSLRNRLQVVTQSIQTSAVFVQTSATRRNTSLLKEIDRSNAQLNLGLAVFGAVVTFFGLIKDYDFTWAAVAALSVAAVLLLSKPITKFLQKNLTDSKD